MGSRCSSTRRSQGRVCGPRPTPCRRRDVLSGGTVGGGVQNRAMTYRDELRAIKDDHALLTHLAGWKPGSEQYLLVQAEIDRRRSRWPEIRSWAAFAISIAALLVSIFKK